MVEVEVCVKCKCDICGSKTEKCAKVCYGYETPKPVLPNDWRIIDGATVCPKHEVRFVDAQEREAVTHEA
jgi:hypothetical protein